MRREAPVKRSEMYVLYAIALASLLAVAFIGADQFSQADGSRKAIANEVRERSAAERRALDATKHEGTIRRKQLCDLFLRRDQINRRRLAGTLAYVAHLSPDERKTSLNRAVISSIPQARADIKADKPPPFCHPRAQPVYPGPPGPI